MWWWGWKRPSAVWPLIELELRFQNECVVCYETKSLVSKFKVLAQLLTSEVRQIIQYLSTNLRGGGALARLLCIGEDSGKKPSIALQKPFQNNFGHFIAQMKTETPRAQRRRTFSGYWENRTSLYKQGVKRLHTCTWASPTGEGDASHQSQILRGHLPRKFCQFYVFSKFHEIVLVILQNAVTKIRAKMDLKGRWGFDRGLHPRPPNEKFVVTPLYMHAMEGLKRAPRLSVPYFVRAPIKKRECFLNTRWSKWDQNLGF